LSLPLGRGRDKGCKKLTRHCDLNSIKNGFVTFMNMAAKRLTDLIGYSDGTARREAGVDYPCYILLTNSTRRNGR